MLQSSSKLKNKNAITNDPLQCHKKKKVDRITHKLPGRTAVKLAEDKSTKIANKSARIFSGIIYAYAYEFYLY